MGKTKHFLAKKKSNTCNLVYKSLQSPCVSWKLNFQFHFPRVTLRCLTNIKAEEVSGADGSYLDRDLVKCVQEPPNNSSKELPAKYTLNVCWSHQAQLDKSGLYLSKRWQMIKVNICLRTIRTLLCHLQTINQSRHSPVRPFLMPPDRSIKVALRDLESFVWLLL